MRWFQALVVVSLVACGPTPPASDAGVGGGAGGGDTGGGGAGGGVPDTVPPQVVSTMPAALATNVATGATVQLVFSEAMNPASVTVSASPGVTFSGPVWNAANTSVTLTPASALAAATSYTLTVNGADAAGNALSPAFTFTFTTAPPADTTPPTVTTTVPAGGATGVPTSTPLSVSFSEAMNPATVTLVVSPSVALSTLSWSSASELTVSPVSALGFSTTYTVTVSGDDLAGNALAAPATFSFTTGGPPDTTPPTLQSSTPTGGAVGVTKATRLSITFSEQMSPATVSVDVNPSLELGTEAWGNENRTISFPSPADDWAFSTTYTVTVMGSDVAGNPMTESTITFTTETPPDTTRPTIVSAAPGAGALNVPVNTNLEFTFSEPMDQAATEAAFSSTPAVTCVFTWNTRRTLMSCNPSVNLSFGTAYMARIGTGARDDAGNALAVQFQAAFTTAAAPDTTHPTVTATTPTSGQVGVSRYGNVIVTFSEPMRQGATVAAFQFTSPAAHPFTYGWNPAGTVLTINPATDFVYGQLVTFTIGTGAEDLAGNALQSSVTRSFRVKRQTTQRFYFSGTTNTGVIAQPEGFIRGTASCSTASVYHSSTYGAAGDSYSTTSPNNSAYRGFVTFNIGSLSALTGVSILSASATLQQGGCVGDPFSPAFGGAVVLEHVDIGATLGLEDCGAPNLGGRRAVLSTTSGSGLKTALVTTAVRDDFTNVSARGGRSQFRIQTSTLTQSDGDMVSDYCTYWTSNVSGTATDPYLTITYEYD